MMCNDCPEFNINVIDVPVPLGVQLIPLPIKDHVKDDAPALYTQTVCCPALTPFTVPNVFVPLFVKEAHIVWPLLTVRGDTNTPPCGVE